jgi:hypothetical protein
VKVTPFSTHYWLIYSGSVQRNGIQFIVPGRHAAKLFKAAEEPLDGVALRIAGRVVGTRVSALAPRRDDGYGTVGNQGGHERIRIVAAIRNENLL